MIARKRTTYLTRRTAVTGIAASIASHFTAVAQQNPVSLPSSLQSVDLGQGLEIRDYRLFPTKDALRFIVELHNASDDIIDTPSVGAILPHLDPAHNFAWANPVSVVLHPGMSDCLIGIAPRDLVDDDDWGQPSWSLCGLTTSYYVDMVEGWDIEVTHRVEIVNSDHAVVHLQVENRSPETPNLLCLKGIVRDGDNRICGALLPIMLESATTGHRFDTIVNVSSDQSYIANPFALIDTAEHISVAFSLQPYHVVQIVSSCMPVLPWGRAEN